MIMLDILEWIGPLTYSETGSIGLYMLEDTKDHIGSCQRCQMAKGKQQLAPLQPYHASAPMELVHIELLNY